MAVALFTLGFLITGWAAIAATLVLLDDHGVKIAAALKGRSLLSVEPVAALPVTMRFSPRLSGLAYRPARTRIEWRAAA